MKGETHIGKLVLILAFCLFFKFNLQAQQQRVTWLFGNQAGLLFNGRSAPQFISNAQFASFGTSTVSDCSGKLLLYSNGEAIYDSSGQKITNGTLINSSGSEECLFVPHPGNTLQYYLFHLKRKGDSLHLAYSVIDFSSGAPVVIKKTIILDSCVDNKLTATFQKNGRDCWLLAHKGNSDEFMAYRIDQNGLDTIPVNSHCGIAHTGVNYQDGQMRFSLSGNKIALAVNSIDLVENFDFNKQTGIVSNPKHFAAGNFIHPFGVSFSQDEQLLYISTNVSPRLYQLDLSDPNIYSTGNALLLDSLYSGTFGEIQYGPDGNIYIAIAISSYIAKINSPCIKGIACNYQRNAVYLGGAFSYSALPNFIQSYFDKVYDFTTSDKCINDSITFFVNTLPDNSLNVNWLPGDSSDIPVFLSGNFLHQYTSTGNYQVQLIVHYPCYDDTLYNSVKIKPLPVFRLGNDTSICFYDTLLLNANVMNANYYWSTGDTGNFINATAGNVYYLTVSEDGCAVTDSIVVGKLKSPAPLITGALNVCNELGLSTVLQSSPAFNYRWSVNNDTSSTVLIKDPGSYILTVNYESGCTNKLSFTVTESCPILFYAPTAFTPNDDGLNDFFQVTLNEYKTFSIKIYNRFGELVFSGDTPDKSWDGKNCETGMYYYIVYILNTDNKTETLRGEISLLR